MTSVGQELREMVQMLERLPADEQDRLLRALDGASRLECEVTAQRFRPLPFADGSSRVVVRTRIVER
ncbi:hypothetical protein GCM10010095_81340 [Streptomyces anthocyanicus]|nr:hypothetical protein GCM10010095_81340 [Streptomyces anthocyanicus]